jgi:hypothetical protein
VSDSGTAGGKRRWYEKLGMQINHPPPEHQPQRRDDYVRPSRWTVVAPARIASSAYVGTLALTLVVLIAAGVPFDLAWPFTFVAALAAQYTVDAWWRHNRPPSADPPRRSLFSKNPDDYL